jgi:nitroimidazol reductase NimA-like FMN-containing flavoprotein (pyridoxamine 5'-phosphate oxidase superfamily)
VSEPWTGLDVLDEAACRERLGRVRVGRVAITIEALPVVLPVNYRVLDGDIVFCTAAGTKLDAAVRNAVVAFEVDEVDVEARVGWSVLVIGHAEEIVDAGEKARAAALGIDPWVDGSATRFVRIHAERVSGRRIAGAG